MGGCLEELGRAGTHLQCVGALGLGFGVLGLFPMGVITAGRESPSAAPAQLGLQGILFGALGFHLNSAHSIGLRATITQHLAAASGQTRGPLALGIGPPLRGPMTHAQHMGAHRAPAPRARDKGPRPLIGQWATEAGQTAKDTAHGTQNQGRGTQDAGHAPRLVKGHGARPWAIVLPGWGGAVSIWLELPMGAHKAPAPRARDKGPRPLIGQSAAEAGQAAKDTEHGTQNQGRGTQDAGHAPRLVKGPVSYTHLTLPTICSV